MNELKPGQRLFQLRSQTCVLLQQFRPIRRLARLKIGQILALLGEHFLPPVLTDALHKLHSRTAPIPWSDIEPLLREALEILSKKYESVDSVGPVFVTNFDELDDPEDRALRQRGAYERVQYLLAKLRGAG